MTVSLYANVSLCFSCGQEVRKYKQENKIRKSQELLPVTNIWMSNLELACRQGSAEEEYIGLAYRVRLSTPAVVICTLGKQSTVTALSKRADVPVGTA